MAKKRIPIPKAVAARVLFSSDRTCCVCRVNGKKIQIHHVDDDPSNNDFSNLAILCLECHGDTQTTGGFGRQLDAEQVRLYRDDWHRIITESRVQNYRQTRDEIEPESNRIKYVTALTERLRESKDYVTLAGIYNEIGNDDLRDKYVEMALEVDTSDWAMIYLRDLQDRRDLIPDEVADRRLNEQLRQENWLQRARTLVHLGRYIEAAHDYVKGILNSLEDGRVFGAAFYLKEVFKEDLVNRLFERALQEATEEGDLWWQVRSLQELGWRSELKDLLVSHRKQIESSGHPMLLPLLLHALGDEDAADAAFIDSVASPGEVGESDSAVANNEPGGQPRQP